MKNNQHKLILTAENKTNIVRHKVTVPPISKPLIKKGDLYKEIKQRKSSIKYLNELSYQNKKFSLSKLKLQPLKNNQLLSFDFCYDIMNTGPDIIPKGSTFRLIPKTSSPLLFMNSYQINNPILPSNTISINIKVLVNLYMLLPGMILLLSMGLFAPNGTISKNSTNENESMSHYAEIGASIDSVEDSPQEKEQVQKTDISKEETNSELQDANTEIIYQELERDFHISLKFDKKAIIDLIKISDYDIVTIKEWILNKYYDI